AATDLSPLSLHDALPISPRRRARSRLATWLSVVPGLGQLYNRQPKKAVVFLFGVVLLFLVTLNIPGATAELLAFWKPRGSTMVRSEEHTSELQSPCNLVC